MVVVTFQLYERTNFDQVKNLGGRCEAFPVGGAENKNALHDMVRNFDVDTSGYNCVSCGDFASCSNKRVRSGMTMPMVGQ